MSIFNTRIMKLDNINMEITEKNIKLYDDKVLERTIGSVGEEEKVGENVVEIQNSSWDEQITQEINKLNINALKVKMYKLFRLFI